jgi:hypothetical protein
VGLVNALGRGTMPEAALTLTSANVLGLFFIQRYRFLTIAQFAKADGLSKRHAEDLLHTFGRRGIVGSFGNVTIPGHGKTPKVYFLKRKGWELLRTESGIPDELIGSFAEVHQEASWSPQMYHRLRLLDLFIALELSVRGREHIHLIKTLLEYRRIRRNAAWHGKRPILSIMRRSRKTALFQTARLSWKMFKPAGARCFLLKWTWRLSGLSQISATTGK